MVSLKTTFPLSCAVVAVALSGRQLILSNSAFHRTENRQRQGIGSKIGCELLGLLVYLLFVNEANLEQ